MIAFQAARVRAANAQRRDERINGGETKASKAREREKEKKTSYPVAVEKKIRVRNERDNYRARARARETLSLGGSNRVKCIKRENARASLRLNLASSVNCNCL